MISIAPGVHWRELLTLAIRQGLVPVLLALVACGSESPAAPELPGATGGAGGRGAGGLSAGAGASMFRTGGALSSGGRVATAGAGGVPSSSGAAGSTTNGAGMGSGGTPIGPQPACRLQLNCAQSIVDDPKVPCSLEIRDALGATIYMDQAGVELRGRSSLRYPNLNYGVELRTAAGIENPAPMLGMGKEADWIFDGSWADRSFMRNDLVFSLFRDMGRYAPESRSCTLSLNGREQGIYRLSEKIKRDDDRVPLPLDDGTGSTFIISQDEDGGLDFTVGTASGSSVWQLVYPKEETATAAQKQAAQTFLNGLKAAMTGNDPAHPTTGIFAYLDLAATVDFILIEEFSKNIDAYNLSLNLFRNQGSKAAFIPWDFDLAFGQPTTRGTTNEAPEGWVQNRTAFITALVRVPDLLSRLGPRWSELRAGPLSEAQVLARLDQLEKALVPELIAANFAVWPIDQVRFEQIYRPYTFYQVSSHAEEVQRLRSWVQRRLVWMDSRIGSYPN